MYTSWLFIQDLFYFFYQYGQIIHNQKSSEMNSLPFYMFMPPLQFHHPKRFKVLYLLSKHHYLQHLPIIVRETHHAILYSLHIPWLSCSSFLTHHFVVVFLELFFHYESNDMNNNYKNPCCIIHLHYMI